MACIATVMAEIMPSSSFLQGVFRNTIPEIAETVAARNNGICALSPRPNVQPLSVLMLSTP